MDRNYYKTCSFQNKLKKLRSKHKIKPKEKSFLPDRPKKHGKKLKKEHKRDRFAIDSDENYSKSRWNGSTKKLAFKIKKREDFPLKWMFLLKIRKKDNLEICVLIKSKTTNILLSSTLRMGTVIQRTFMPLKNNEVYFASIDQIHISYLGRM